MEMTAITKEVTRTSDFGIYSGEELLTLKLDTREFLVENLIREKDTVILVGNEKRGKSLLIYQLICSLTSQHPFLDKWDILKSCKVTYIQLEGELSDSQDRLERMIKVQEFDPKLFYMHFCSPLQLHLEEGMERLVDDIRRHHMPDIVIIDPIYFAFTGSLSNDEIVRQFIGNLRILKDRLGCAIMLVHHTHKAKFNYKGNTIKEGDEAMFGSKFLKAYPDHTLFLSYDPYTEIRSLSCGTQRSGDIVKQCDLKLVEPDPLYFEILKGEPTKEDIILAKLMLPEYKEGLSQEEVTAKTGISRSTFYASMKKPITNKTIIKDESKRPVIYKYNWDMK